MSEKSKLSAIILCAGYSSRMGTLKPLLKFENETALELLVHTFSACEIDDIIVVVGYSVEKIMKTLNHINVEWVINPKYDTGMYSSVKEGVKSVKKESQGFFLIPVDVPIIKRNTIESLKKEFSKTDKGIVYPTFMGRRGHPPVISTYYRDIILDNLGSTGLKNLLRQYENDASDFPVCDNGILLDMDEYDDYLVLKEYFRMQYVPNYEECKAIWNRYELPSNIIKHSEVVASVAINIGEKLLKKGCYIDIDKIKAAALLHDIGRKEKNHAKFGERILKDLGYNEVADIVSTHMDINVRSSFGIDENEILYLADKLVLDDRIVTLDDRFKQPFEKFKDNPEILHSINIKYENAKFIEDKVNRFIK